MDVVDHVAGAGAFDSTVGRAGQGCWCLNSARAVWLRWIFASVTPVNRAQAAMKRIAIGFMVCLSQ